MQKEAKKKEGAPLLCSSDSNRMNEEMFKAVLSCSWLMQFYGDELIFNWFALEGELCERMKCFCELTSAMGFSLSRINENVTVEELFTKMLVPTFAERSSNQSRKGNNGIYLCFTGEKRFVIATKETTRAEESFFFTVVGKLHTLCPSFTVKGEHMEWFCL